MGRHFLIWIGLLLLMPIFTPVLTTAEMMEQWLRAEYDGAIAIVGEKETAHDDIDAVWKERLGGLEMMVTVVAKDFPRGVPNTVKYYIYGVALRLAIIVMLWPWLLMPVICGSIAGFAEWRLKGNTFGATNPIIFGISSHVLLILFGIFCTWLITPLPVPLWASPGLVMMVAFFVCQWIAHFPRY